MNRDEAIRVLRSPEGRQETRRIYHLRMTADLATQVIAQGHVSRQEAEELIDGVAKLAETYFPGSQETFRIVYGRRFARLIVEVFGPTHC